MKIVELPFKVKVPILACGADMKGAFALAKADRAYLVDGFGELYDPDNLNAYEAAIKSHESKLNIKPSIVVCDLHPSWGQKFAMCNTMRHTSPARSRNIALRPKW